MHTNVDDDVAMRLGQHPVSRRDIGDVVAVGAVEHAG